MHLTTEQQIKSDLIKDIDSVYLQRTDKHLSEQDFDFLYDKTVSELIEFTEFYKDIDNHLEKLAALAREIMNHMSKGE
jgi:hypothetical protein